MQQAEGNTMQHGWISSLMGKHTAGSGYLRRGSVLQQAVATAMRVVEKARRKGIPSITGIIAQYGVQVMVSGRGVGMPRSLQILRNFCAPGLVAGYRDCAL
jgi:hypothetical protein